MRKLLLSILLLSSTLAWSDAYLDGLARSGYQLHGSQESYDRQRLYFSAKVPGAASYDLYVAHLENGVWSSPVLLSDLSSGQDDWNPAISPDEQQIYFVRREVRNPGTRQETAYTHLYGAVRLPSGSWQAPQQLVISSGTDLEPELLVDGRTLLFTSSRPQNPADDKGPVAHFVSQKIDKYNFTTPRVLAAGESGESLRQSVLRISGSVSSKQPTTDYRVDVYNALTQQLVAHLEVDPMGRFYTALCRGVNYKLDCYRKGYSHYYQWVDARNLERDSSVTVAAVLSPELHFNLSAFDEETQARLHPVIKINERESSSQAHLPIGKRYTINLHQDTYADTTFVLDTERDIRFDQTDIDVNMRPGHARVHLLTVDAATAEPLPTQVTVQLADNRREMTLPVGDTTFLLHCGDSYQLEASAVGYIFKDTIVQMPLTEELLQVQLALYPMQKNKIIQLRNIQFEFNSSLFREESTTQLHQVADLMRQNPGLRIEISAHTDDVGSEAYNNRLSQQRARSVMVYLIEQEQIDPSRLTSAGYGKSRPLVPNDTDENRALNRRVEFTILEVNNE